MSTLSFTGPDLGRAVSKDQPHLRELFRDEPEWPAPPSIIDEPQTQMLERLWATITEQKQPDRDSEDSEPAHPDSFVRAYEFVMNLPIQTPVPDFYVDSEGEINLEWEYGPRAVFSVAVGPDGSLAYAGLFGGSKIHGIESIGVPIPSIVLESITRVWQLNPR